ASDTSTKRAYYEKALEVDPFATGAMDSLAGLIERDDPKRALDLRLRRLRLYTRANSITYERIARLQLQLRLNQDAMSSVKMALAIAPYRVELYQLRQAIERALGHNDRDRTLHLAAGYRSAAGSYASVKNDNQAIVQYMHALELAVSVPTNDDTGFEVEAA